MARKKKVDILPINEAPATLVLTPTNYISIEADRAFMSFHQWQSWIDCPARTKAKMEGKFTEEMSDAFLVGQYVDHKLLTPENYPVWENENLEKINNKQGKPKAWVANADKMVAALQNDPIAVKMIEGDKQWIVTGEIAGVPWRGMVDIIKAGSEIFTDLKTCRDVGETFWDKDIGMKVFWWEHYNYWTQVAVYRELIFQRYGKKFLPMLLAVDKQDPPDKVALAFEDQYRLDQEIEQIVARMPEVMAYKNGTKEARRCEHCAYCRGTKQLKIQVASNQGIKKPAYMDW